MAQIIPLSEGVFTIGHDKQFVPFNPDQDELTDRPTGSLLVEVQPFLVITEKDVLMLDTGLGFVDPTSGEPQIHQLLRQHGYEPHQVTKVLLSHLHKDHAAGVTFSENGNTRLMFPAAEYYIYRPEAEFALKTGLPSYHPADLEPLLSSGQVKWLDGESGVIDHYIRFEHSGGHCPEHVVFLIEEGAQRIFFGGDEAPQLKQMKIRYVAKYDYDGKKASLLREQYGERGRAEGWEFLFYHDVKIPVAQL
jgi:glyoxylase-like metal-dependent hydrolase (beta-lactamase superfamily II)